MLYTVFCDESCHLQKDNSSIMVLGAMYYPSEKRKQILSNFFVSAKKDYEKDYQNYIKEIEKERK